MEAIKEGLPADAHRCSLFFPTMVTLDAASEWRRLAEHYRRLTDEELLDLSTKNSELTDSAKQALAQEMTQRRLKPSWPEQSLSRSPSPPANNVSADDVYAQDRELVPLCTVWSLSDALQLQKLLDSWGIPFYMGPEQATSAERVTSTFKNGVDVEIMRVGWPWALQAMRNYNPADDPVPTPEELYENYAIRCPKCRSADATFERLVKEQPNGNDSQKFEWTCGHCGCHWVDEGVMTKG